MNDSVMPGYPRKIRDDFVTKPGLNVSDPMNIVPNEPDASFFNPIDGFLYFFKGDLVCFTLFSNHKFKSVYRISCTG